jgi:K(+)-stimulated pyrophosphate-energized sodium pump
MSTAYWVVIACGGLAILYGLYASRSVLGASAGNEKMQEIASRFRKALAPI